MKIYKVLFEPVYPVGGCLIIAANNKRQAKDIAAETIIHTKDFIVEQVDINKPCVVVYQSGDY